jgi:hypothetical protein
MIRGTHPDVILVDELPHDPALDGVRAAQLDELDAAFSDVYPGVGRAELDADGRFTIELPSGKTEVGELPHPRVELRELPDADGRLVVLSGRSYVQHLDRRRDLPDPAAVLAAGAGAAAVEVARMVEEWSAAVTEAGRQLAPLFEAMAAGLRAAVASCEAVGLLPPPPTDAREELLAAKRAPGRTGPPAPRMDGRRGR